MLSLGNVLSVRNEFFDPKTFEADTKAERERLQKQFLADAYKYLAEKDPEAVRTLEEELDQPGYRRWQEWFDEAKKFKRKQLKQKDSRIRRRVQAARAAGYSQAQVEKEVNSDTSDSAYNTDIERESRQPSEMGPPDWPASRRPKRKTYTVADSKVNGNKRRATSTSTGSPGVFMSGANGSRSPSMRPSPPIRSDTAGLNHIIEGCDYQDQTMDTRPPHDSQSPPPLPPHLAGVQGQWGFGMPNTPPSTGRRLGSEPARQVDRNYKSQLSRSLNGLDDPDVARRARRHQQDRNDLDLDDDEAVQRAIEASLEPEGVRGEDNDETVQRAIEASLEPESMRGDDVIESTEADIEDST